MEVTSPKSLLGWLRPSDLVTNASDFTTPYWNVRNLDLKTPVLADAEVAWNL